MNTTCKQNTRMNYKISSMVPQNSNPILNFCKDLLHGYLPYFKRWYVEKVIFHDYLFKRSNKTKDWIQIPGFAKSSRLINR